MNSVCAAETDVCMAPYLMALQQLESLLWVASFPQDHSLVHDHLAELVFLAIRVLLLSVLEGLQNLHGQCVIAIQVMCYSKANPVALCVGLELQQLMPGLHKSRDVPHLDLHVHPA